MSYDDWKLATPPEMENAEMSEQNVTSTVQSCADAFAEEHARRIPRAVDDTGSMSRWVVIVDGLESEEMDYDRAIEQVRIARNALRMGYLAALRAVGIIS